MAVGLMKNLAGSSALVAPLLLHFLLPLMSGDETVRVNAVQMVGTLLIAQFLPLCIGPGIRHWRPALADRLTKPANLLSIALNLVTLGVILSVLWEILMAFPIRGYLGMLAAPTRTTRIAGPVNPKDELPARAGELPAKDSMAERRKT
jgi:predicted Na+-dependent transporter